MSDIHEARIRQGQRIKAALELAGYRLRDIDRQFELPAGSAGRSLYEPNERAEKAIAKALIVHPKTLWVERYDQSTGRRLSPQPQANYDWPTPIRQRRRIGRQQVTGEVA